MRVGINSAAQTSSCENLSRTSTRSSDVTYGLERRMTVHGPYIDKLLESVLLC
jgi:hypothetical protein